MKKSIFSIMFFAITIVTFSQKIVLKSFLQLESPSNSLYIGIANRFTLINNEDLSDYKTKCVNCHIGENSIIINNKKPVSLTIYKLIDNDTVVFYQKIFTKNKYINDLYLGVNNKRFQENISKDELLKSKGLEIVIADLDIALGKEVKSFYLSIPSKKISLMSDNNQFTQQMRNVIRKLEKGEKIIFKNIKFIIAGRYRNFGEVFVILN